jgi:hypothetical protein
MSDELDPDLFSTWDVIDRHGWMCQYVFGCLDSLPWAYTIGLAGGWDHPELIVVGLDPDWSGHLLNQLGEQVRDGRRFSHGDLVDLDLDEPISLGDVHRDNYRTSLFAMWLHYYSALGPPYPEEAALEVVLPGRNPRLHRAVTEDCGRFFPRDSRDRID